MISVSFFLCCLRSMQAAQELKKAMESGNAQVLKEAIDKAKLHKVSPEA